VLALATVVQHVLLPLREERGGIQRSLHPLEYFVSGGIYQKMGRFSEALYEYDRLAARVRTRPSFQPLWPTIWAQKAQIHMHWAHAISRNQAAAAIAHMDQAYALAQNLSTPVIHWEFAHHYAQLGASDRARRSLQAYLLRDPGGVHAAQARQLLAAPVR
jgi:predicted Zn-dependent protease